MAYKKFDPNASSTLLTFAKAVKACQEANQTVKSLCEALGLPVNAHNRGRAAHMLGAMEAAGLIQNLGRAPRPERRSGAYETLWGVGK